MLRINIIILCLVLFGCGSNQDVRQNAQEIAISNMSIPGNPYDVILKDDRFVDVKFKRVGSKVKVIINDVIKPNVIIQPKSIIGFIPLKIKDKKANAVVKTV